MGIDERPTLEPELDLLLEGISILMDWRNIGPFSATVFHKLTGEDEEIFSLKASPADLTYELTNLRTGDIERFDSATGKVHSHGHESDFAPHMFIFEPLPVRLAFTPALGIWGRSSDDYRLTGAITPSDAHDTDSIVLTLSHMLDKSVTGTLAISRHHRHAVRLDTPTQTCRYESIEPQ